MIKHTQRTHQYQYWVRTHIMLNHQDKSFRIIDKLKNSVSNRLNNRTKPIRQYNGQRDQEHTHKGIDPM